MNSSSHDNRVNVEDGERQGSASRGTREYIDWIATLCRHPGDRARLRRTLRNDDTIDATAWWMLGAWLPNDHDDALISVRIAGLYAASEGTDPGIPWRNPGGEMRLAAINETVARRVLESVTAPGSSTGNRIAHLARILPQCSGRGARIDWALLHDDLRGLNAGGHDRQRRIRSRWYRQFHNPNPSREGQANE